MSAFDSKSYPYWLGTYSSGDSSSSVPIGSVEMWLTATPPTNWFLLQGQKLNINTYNSLYSVIGNTYSSGGGVPGGLFCSTYSASAGTITFNLFGSQVNFSLSVGDTFIATGFTASVGASVNGTSFTVLSAPAINATGGSFTATTTLTSGDNGISGNITRTNFSLPDTRARVLRGAGTGYALGATGGADTKTLVADNLPQHTHGLLAGSAGVLAYATSGYGGAITGSTGNYLGRPGLDTIATTITDVGGTYLNNTAKTAVANSAVNIVNPYIVINYIIKYA
jgi:microcystin-dependent protein